MFHFNDLVKGMDMPQDMDMSLNDVTSKVSGYIQEVNDVRWQRAKNNSAYTYQKYKLEDAFELIKLPVPKEEFLQLCEYFMSILNITKHNNSSHLSVNVNPNNLLNNTLEAYVSEETVELTSHASNLTQALTPFKERFIVRRADNTEYENILEGVYERVLFPCQIFTIPDIVRINIDRLVTNTLLDPCAWEDLSPTSIFHLYHIKNDNLQHSILNTALLTIPELVAACSAPEYTLCAILAAGAISAPTLVEDKDAAPLLIDVYEQSLISRIKLIRTIEYLNISYLGVRRLDENTYGSAFISLPQLEPISLNEFPTCSTMLDREKLIHIIYNNINSLGILQYRGSQRRGTLPVTRLSRLPTLSKRILEILTVLETDLKEDSITADSVSTACKLVSDRAIENIKYIATRYGVLTKLDRRLVIKYDIEDVKLPMPPLPGTIQAFIITDSHSICIPFLMGINKYKVLTMLFPNNKEVLEFLRVRYFDSPTDPLQTLGNITEHFKTLGQKSIELLFSKTEIIIETHMQNSPFLEFTPGPPSLVDITSYFEGEAYNPGDAPNNKNIFWEVPLIYSESSYKHSTGSRAPDNTSQLSFGKVQSYRFRDYYFRFFNNIMEVED